MLEIPIFGPDDGAAAVMAGAQRLELNRAGSYGKSILSCTFSSPSHSKRNPAVATRSRPLTPPHGRPVPSHPHLLFTYP